MATRPARSLVRVIAPKGDGWSLEAHPRDREGRRVLRSVGGSHGWLTSARWTVRVPDAPQLASVISALDREGFAFVDAPHGWPPAAVVGWLRERGLLEGTFTRAVGSDDGAVFLDF